MQAATTTPCESPFGRQGSIRASSLILCLLGLLSLALVGPNRVRELLLGSQAEKVASTPATIASASAAHSMHYQQAELPRRETSAAAVAPRLALPARGTLSAEEYSAEQYEPAAPVQPAEYVFREQPDGQRDHMQSIQQRLQLLGARYMRLETWGDITPRYRFLCRMPDGRGGLSDHEFVSDDPIDAMQRVLYQVEARMAARGN